ncbi:MAG: GNAT family N-acetyltransferase [Actinomycetota bacterium]|nr:GNAT family N-acetyltransferase [Actinomycetota bacterium]
MGPLDPELRRLGPDDWETYRSIRLEMLRDSPDAFLTSYDDAAAQDEAVWRRRLAGGCTFVAELHGETVGSVTCWVGSLGSPGHAADLGAMYVGPSARGRGVGQALVLAALQEARETGRHVVRLEVVETNALARSLYERTGFRMTGVVVPRALRPHLHDVQMECRL